MSSTGQWAMKGSAILISGMKYLMTNIRPLYILLAPLTMEAVYSSWHRCGTMQPPPVYVSEPADGGFLLWRVTWNLHESYLNFAQSLKFVPF